MKVADAIAHTLKAEGIDTIFTYPVNPIIEAAAVADIRTIVVRQERIGLHMADAYSRPLLGQEGGRFHHAARPRRRERLRRRGAGVFRIVAHSGAAGRLSAPPRALLSELQLRAEHAQRHQVGGNR